MKGLINAGILLVLCLGLAGCATVGEVGYGIGRAASGYQQARIDAAVDQRLRQQYRYRPRYHRGRW